MSASQRLSTRQQLGLGKSIGGAIALFAFAASLTFLFLILSPFGAFRVEVVLDSSASGTSQMFFAADASSFSEKQSQSQRVFAGSNHLAFVGNPIRETIDSSLRWDPLDEPAMIEVHSFEVRGFLLVEEFDPAEILRPSLDVSEVLSDGKLSLIQTLSSDGQVIVDVDVKSLYRDHILVIIAASLVVGLLASLVGGSALLVGQRSRRSVTAVGLNWQVFVVSILGTSIAISVGWSLVAR